MRRNRWILLTVALVWGTLPMAKGNTDPQGQAQGPMQAPLEEQKALAEASALAPAPAPAEQPQTQAPTPEPTPTPSPNSPTTNPPEPAPTPESLSQAPAVQGTEGQAGLGGQGQNQVEAKPTPAPKPTPEWPKDPGHEDYEIFVSLKEQTAKVFKNGELVLESPTSTGRRGYGTPKGTFTIVEKKRHHTSSIYGAPMPYLLRLSEWSIAFHAGYVPGGKRRASHGCIRLPAAKAKEFYSVIPRGTKVTITD
jgi:lipoprotein-anchoring transpeptidase ErfK/SrfK